MINQLGTHLIIRILPHNNAHVTVMYDGEWVVMFTLAPKVVVKRLMVLLITDVKFSCGDSTSYEFITILSALSTVSQQMDWLIPRCCGMDNTLLVKFGMDANIAPYAFRDTPSFFESLRMEEVLLDEDDVYFEVIDEITDNVVVLNTDGLHCIREVFAPDSMESAYLWN